jgi:hypothetical protein
MLSSVFCRGFQKNIFKLGYYPNMKKYNLSNRFKFLIRLAGLALLVNTMFIGLHYLGNFTTVEKAASRIQEAIDTLNVLPEDYPALRNGIGTPYVFAGIDQYTDCNIVYQMSLFRPEKRIRNAIVPGIAEPPAALKNSIQQCQKVIGIIKKGAYPPADPRTSETKARLWHGAKAVFQLLAPSLTIFQMKILMQQVTYLLYMLIGVLFMGYGPYRFLAFLPFVIFGILFSGIPYFADLSNGLPYMIVLLGIAILLLVGRRFRHCPQRPLAIVVTVFGSLHAFFFVTDGAEMLVIPLLMVALYFACLDELPRRERLISTLSLLLLYVAALAGSLIFKQIISMAVLGFSQVSSEFIEILTRRVSGDLHGSHITVASTLEINFGWYLIDIYWIKWLYSVLLYTSMAAWSFGLALLTYKLIDGRDRARAFDASIFVLAGLAVLTRYIIMRNHSYEHAVYVSRYIFVFLASGWALTLHLLVGPNSLHTHLSEPAMGYDGDRNPIANSRE